MQNTDFKADFIVVGAGSAGCAMTYRLAVSGARVLLVEAGGSDMGPLIQMPAALSYPMNMPLYDWGYRSEPEPHLGGRRLAVPRGRVVGGSSSVNGMVYVRGHARDYETWADMGARGWRYADVLPYFQRMETWHGGPDHNADTAKWRGTDGPLHVRRGPRDNPLHAAFERAANETGYASTPDYNGQAQEGFGAMEQTIHKGRRWSTANAYLRPALKTGRVQMIRGLAEQIVFDADNRATGLKMRRRGRTITLAATREVILCAGSINTPKLLMLSGIGPAADLTANGITPRLDRPGVGANLQDHQEVYLQMACKQPITLYKHWNLFSKGLIGLQWQLFKRGLGASNQFETAGFIRSNAGVDYPDIQFHFLPIAVRYDGKAAAAGHGFQAHVGPMRSPSRGWVKLDGPRADTAPRIQFNAMSTDQDWVDFRKAVRLTREIFAAPAMAAFAGVEIQPGPDAQSDAAIDDFLRDHMESAFHPCATARMGAVDDPMAVVDPTGSVIGTRNLRVADSSIFPRITNGNLNGPSIMVGEKISDHVLGRGLPPRPDLVPRMAMDWQNTQR